MHAELEVSGVLRMYQHQDGRVLGPCSVEIVGFGDFKLMPWKVAPIGIFLLRKCRMMILSVRSMIILQRTRILY